MFFFVDVIVPLPLANTFTYGVNAYEFQQLELGCRVVVPFGKNKVYTALVVKKHQEQPLLYQAKEIEQVLDVVPVVTKNQLKLWQWISDYYLSSIGQVYTAAMPSNLLLESQSILIYKPENTIDLKSLSDDEFLIYEAFQKQAVLKLSEVEQIIQSKKIFPVIHSMLQKEMLFLQDEMIETYRPKEIKCLHLSDKYQNSEGLKYLLESVAKSAKQKQVILAYFQHQATSKKQVVTLAAFSEIAQVSEAVIKGLIKKEIFYLESQKQDRVVFSDAKATLQLSELQEKACHEIENSFKKQSVCLLHGITGSGKTEVYIKLIKNQLKSEKQILFLVPEIGLTQQLVERLVKYFGNQLAVYHSKYNLNERLEVWHNVLENSENARIVVGARSSVFLPFSNLGLIIVDEEHDGSYKQKDSSPRYHARDVAIVLGKMHQANVLLGSATPSLESYYNAYQNKFAKVVLNQRYGQSQTPSIELIDLKEKYQRKQMTGHFSHELISEISQSLFKNEQVILFQNRRGFSPVLECNTCGYVPKCSSCDVSLTYYRSKNILKCHYCGYSIANPISCAVCSSPEISTKGFGTEQIELELKTLFPEHSIARLDQDTTKGKNAFEKICSDFATHRTDILVGTQMLAKGLDFKNVTLVGVLNADNILFFPDFRAYEKAFQMLLQVSGRAGRSEKKGKVIIQTFNPNHSIIQQVTTNDYASMFKEQMYERLQFNYPPFYRLIHLELKHVDYQKLHEGSLWLYKALQSQLKMPVLGPEEPAVSRVRNQYIRVILVKIPVQLSLKATKNIIQEKLKSFESISAYRAIKVSVNVDFY